MNNWKAFFENKAILDGLIRENKNSEIIRSEDQDLLIQIIQDIEDRLECIEYSMLRDLALDLESKSLMVREIKIKNSLPVNQYRSLIRETSTKPCKSSQHKKYYEIRDAFTVYYVISRFTSKNKLKLNLALYDGKMMLLQVLRLLSKRLSISLIFIGTILWPVITYLFGSQINKLLTYVQIASLTKFLFAFLLIALAIYYLNLKVKVLKDLSLKKFGNFKYKVKLGKTPSNEFNLLIAKLNKIGVEVFLEFKAHKGTYYHKDKISLNISYSYKYKYGKD